MGNTTMLKKVALFRDGELVEIRTPVKIEPEQWLRHTTAYYPNENVVQEFREIFDYSGFTCPCCDTAIYNSVNWLQGPGWFLARVADQNRKKAEDTAAAKQVQEDYERRSTE